MSPVARAARYLRADAARFSVAWVYLVVALLWGMALVVAMPPFQTSDEPEHFFRSWAMAEGHPLVGSDSLVDVPLNVGTLNADLHSTEVTSGAEAYDVGTTIHALGDDVSVERLRQFTSSGNYSAVGYVPQAIAIDVVRLFGGSPLLGLYAARIAMLLVCVAMTFVALRLAPVGSALLAVVALLPMSMTLVASVNPGALLDAGAILWVALVLWLVDRGRVRWLDAGCLAAVALLFFTIKPGYALMAALVLVLPPRAFEQRRRYWMTVAACVVGTVAISALILWRAPVVSAAEQVARGALPGLDAGEQMRFIATHPWAFVRVIFSSLSAYAGGWLKDTVGILGRGAVVLSDLITVVAVVGTFVLMMRGVDEGTPLRSWQRWSFVGMAVAVCATVVTALYVTWNPVANPTVVAVQGRYFLPAVPCLLMGLYGWRPRTQRGVQWALVVTVGVMMAGTLYAVLRHYY